MLIKNNKPFKIIGYEESSLTQELFLFGKKFIQDDTSIISPVDFLNLKNKNNFQYFIGFGLDLQERSKIIEILDDYDCISYAHNTSLIFDNVKIGKGVGIANFSSIMQNAIIGNHCIIEAYVLISHNCVIGNNCIFHSGSMVAGKTTIGNNCMFNFKSSAINKINICNNTIIGAFSNVTKNIINPGLYVGSPARLVSKQNEF